MSTVEWKIELHTHTIYSKDCLTRLDRLPAICQKAGIDRLAITDHNTAKAALELARMHPMLIIPGEEIMTTQGEILAWYITESIPAYLSPSETIARLQEQGAVIGVSHPFDRYRKGAWKLEDLLGIVDEIEVIEVFNARCLHQEDNDKALEFARQHRKLMSCGSDAHLATEYGASTIRATPFANNADGLRQALKEGRRQGRLSSPLVHFGSTYAKWVKRLVPGSRVS
jgi:hypothetical protein